MNEILKESEKFVNKLMVLCNFFNNDLLFGIHIKTKIIHNLFVSDEVLDIRKLQLFHAQYTGPLIQLLTTIKKTKERNIVVIYDEINMLNERIGKANSNRPNSQSKKENEMVSFLKNIFEDLTSGSNKFLSHNIQLSSIPVVVVDSELNKREFELVNELISFSDSNMYFGANFKINKKLLGVINKNNYDITYISVIKYLEEEIVLCKLNNVDKMFIYLMSDNIFLPCDKEMTFFMPVETNKSILENRVRELDNKVYLIRNNIDKTHLDIIDDYLPKIEKLDFYDDSIQLDIKSNVLKAMIDIEEV